MNKLNLKAITMSVLKGLIVLSIALILVHLGFSSAKGALLILEDRSSDSPYNIVFEGDSLTADGTYSNDVVNQLNISEGQGNIGHNVATGAQTLYPTMIDDAHGQVDSNLFATRYRNIAVLWAGTNDLYYDEKLTASGLHEYIRDWCSGRKAAGFQVIVCTIAPRSDPDIRENFECRRRILNSLIREHYSEYADGIADIAADPRLGDIGDELDNRYYTDKVHMTATGYSIVACIIRDAIIGLTN